MKGLGAGRKLSLPRSIVLPAYGRVVILHLSHRNTILHRTHGRAQIAAHAGLLDDLHHRTTFPVSRFPSQTPNGLVRSVLTRRPAQLALDALVLIDVGEQVVVEIEILPLRDAGERAAADVRERASPSLVHPVRQPVDQILDDAEA